MQTTPIPHPIPRTLQQKILDAGCLYYKCTWAELKRPEFIGHRKIIIYLLRENAHTKLSGIATLFNYSNHSTSSRIIEEIRSTKDIYAQIRHDINNIMAIVDNLV